MFSVLSRMEVRGQGFSEDSQRIDCQTVGLGCDVLQKLNKFRELNTPLAPLDDSQLCCQNKGSQVLH